MKQGVNNSRLYNKHRYRTFQDNIEETFHDYYNTQTQHTHKGFEG